MIIRQGIQIEQEFLCSWKPEVITQCLSRLMPDYQSLYLDNICKTVLLVTVGCMLGSGNLEQLQVGPKGLEQDCLNVVFLVDEYIVSS